MATLRGRRKANICILLVFLLAYRHGLHKAVQTSIYSTMTMSIPEEQQLLIMPEENEKQRNVEPRKDSATQPQQQKESVHLVYASDDENLPAVKASIRSVMQHASEPVVFHFVGDTRLDSSFSNVQYYNLTEVAAKYRLEEFTNIRKRKEDKVGDLNSNLANFVRFVIHDLLPNAHKAMWVDADTVIECDVVPMVRRTLTKTPHAIAAVPVDRKPRGIATKVLKSQYSKLAVSFNAGVFVVDLDRWRSQGLTKRIRQLTLKNQKKNIYDYGSQPPLVLTIGDKFEHLSPAWNIKVNKLNHQELKGEACLWHWSGKRKPWNTVNDPDVHYSLWQRYATSSDATMQEFQPGNLVLAKRVPCGAQKCFYQLKSDCQAGYLVALSSAPRILQKMGTEANWFEALNNSWTYAERLRRKYHITHFLLAPPTNLTITKDLASQLNGNLWNTGHGAVYDGRYDEGNVERYTEGSTVFVQKVATAPEPNLLLGIQVEKYKTFKRQFNGFLKRIKDKRSFARRFSRSLADTRKILHKEPCLIYDFQLLVDKKGYVYHLDFDRCFQPDVKDETEKCFRVLDEVERQLRHIGRRKS